MREGVRAAARIVPDVRRADAEDVEVTDTRHRHDVLHREHPVPGQAVKPPFAAASVLLDGADIAIFHLLQEVAAEDVRMGMRVEAVWVPDGRAGAERWRASATSSRPASPTRRTTSYKEHL